MARFGGRSLTLLKTVHPRLAHVLNHAITAYDFSIIQSSRTEQEQEADFKKGTTRAHWLQSPHDFNPSFAVDCVPYPLDWSNTHTFFVMASFIKEAGLQLNIPITWGGDFISLKDMPHFELTNWRDLAKQQGNNANDRIA